MNNEQTAQILTGVADNLVQISNNFKMTEEQRNKALVKQINILEGVILILKNTDEN